jgi:hypothetical protein
MVLTRRPVAANTSTPTCDSAVEAWGDENLNANAADIPHDGDAHDPPHNCTGKNDDNVATAVECAANAWGNDGPDTDEADADDLIRGVKHAAEAWGGDGGIHTNEADADDVVEGVEHAAQAWGAYANDANNANNAQDTAEAWGEDEDDATQDTSAVDDSDPDQADTMSGVVEDAQMCGDGDSNDANAESADADADESPDNANTDLPTAHDAEDVWSSDEDCSTSGASCMNASSSSFSTPIQQ